MSVFQKLIEGGLYTLPFLLHIYDDQTNIYVINDNADLMYNGHLYKAASFEYNPQTNGAANLDISIFDNAELANIVNRSRRFNCDLIGVFNGSDETEQLSAYNHQYGEANWDGEKFQIKLEADDRGNMTFPALIYNSYNNRGA